MTRKSNMADGGNLGFHSKLVEALEWRHIDQYIKENGEMEAYVARQICGAVTVQ